MENYFEKATQEIIASGNNPQDFTITVFDGGYSVSPRVTYEGRQLVKQELAPEIADKEALAETLALILEEIEVLKNG